MTPTAANRYPNEDTTMPNNIRTDNSMVDKILQYEAGYMPPDEEVAFFQELIDTGLVWHLQGHYGRTATALIAAGLCSDTR